MNYAQALQWGQKKLTNSDIPTSRLDSLVLLEDNLNVDRAKILANLSTNINLAVLTKYKSQILKRSQHFPLAYIRQQTEFYGRNFFIDQRVLEPRPESETIIEELSHILSKVSGNQILDIGTGSGALAISVKLEYPKLNVYASDINNNCLNVAKINAKKHKTQITFLKGDLIKPLPIDFWKLPTIIIANLPYVPNSWQLNNSAMKEPAEAIFGGQNGLSIYASLFKQLATLDNPPGWVISEALPPQHNQLAKIATQASYYLAKTNDFIQCFSLEPRQVLD